MVKEKKASPLKLSKETLRNLTSGDMHKVLGGSGITTPEDHGHGCPGSITIRPPRP
jgi:hypothetical protein